MIQDDNGGYREMGDARHLMYMKDHQKALPLLLKLRQQRVEHYWHNPRNNLGRIRSMCLCDVAYDLTDEIVVGNDEGQVIAIDIATEEILWSQTPAPGKAIKMVQAGTKDRSKYDSIFVCTGDEHIYVLNEKGKRVEEHELVLENEHIVCLYINRQGKQPTAEMSEVLIGTEEHHIYIYDTDLQTRIAFFETTDTVCTLSSHDLTGNDSSEIIFGTLNGSVYAYRRQGDTAHELWCYKTRGRVHALMARDIDDDGNIEVILGSDDGNVYILSHQGRLKWRYDTASPVLEVNALDIDQDGKSEVLIGTGNNQMLVLTAEGDVRWTFQTIHQVTCIRAKDMDGDSVVEIAVGTETQLKLLQVIDTQTLQDELNLCMKKIRSFGDPKTPIITLTESPNEYIRSYALLTLAGFSGSNKLTEDDFQRLSNALNDSSIEVRKGLAAAAINLGKTITKEDAEGKRQLERLVYGIAKSAIQEIRLTLANLIAMLVELDAELGFDCLKTFIHDEDIWVRRTAVRQLDKLVGSYPTQAFHMLRETVTSNNEWISLESARSLAHYFDIHIENLADETYDFLRTPVAPFVIQQIANNAGKPLVRDFFTLLARLYSEPASKYSLPQADSPRASSPEKFLDDIYRVFYHLLHAQTLADIYEDKYINAIWQLRSVQAVYVRFLKSMIEILLMPQKQGTPYDYAAKLNATTLSLEDLTREVQAESTGEQSKKASPESVLLTFLLQRWYDIIKAELRGIEGQAKIVPEFRTKLVQQGTQYEASIRISNEGNREANNVRVILELTNYNEFEIVGSNERFLGTIAINFPLTATFILKNINIDILRLSFIIIYDDVGWPDRKIFFTDRINSQSAFREIPNPYNSGVPINGNKAMFFGRAESIRYLRSLLLDMQENRIVLLYGQRRSGKTSLINQLKNEIAESDTHLPVFLDIQALPLSFTHSEMLASFAYDILETAKKREIVVADVNLQDFQHEPPLLVFERFLQQIRDALGAIRPIFFIDEFDLLEQFIDDNALSPVISALIAFMKRAEGVRFLLAGDPHMRRKTGGIWSALKENVIAYRLPTLEPEGTQQLITIPVKDFLKYDQRILSSIQKLVNDQPYLTQLLCETIVRLCNKQGADYVDSTHVTTAMDFILDSGINYFTWIWRRLSLQERHVLSALAQDQRAEEQSVSINDIIALHKSYQLQLERDELQHVLASLQEQSIIKNTATANPQRFKVAADLMREWLQRNKPFEKVMRERSTRDLGTV